MVAGLPLLERARRDRLGHVRRTAYYLGHAAEDIFKIGGIAAAAFIVLLVGTYVLWRRQVR